MLPSPSSYSVGAMQQRQHSSRHSPEVPVVATRAQSTPPHQPPQQPLPQHQPVFLPSAHTISTSSASPRAAALAHAYRHPQFQSSHGRHSNRQLPLQKQPFTATVPAPTIPVLAHLAPHSPAVIRNLVAAPVRQSSASMRGTPAAQRMHSASYAHRPNAMVINAASGLPRPPDASSWAPRQQQQQQPSSLGGDRSATATPSPALDGPSYYVVGGAVVNPQLMVSPSVQGEIRGVSTLAALSDAMRRPGVGPQLHNTYGGGGGGGSSGCGSPIPFSTTSSSSPGATSDGASSRGTVICIEGIHTSQLAVEGVPLLQQADGVGTTSLTVLRHLYGTTKDDVLEVAQATQRHGAIESPRTQFHLVQDLLPELTNAEAQLKTLATARRRIDWDVSIPTADTLPPPAITFTTVGGAPVVNLTAVHFAVDTNTLEMQRDFGDGPSAGSLGGAASGSLAGTTRTAPLGGATMTVGSKTTTVGAHPPLLPNEERVGLDVTREERVGSSGLYRIRRLVGLRQGLGEKVGLDRVLEYEVHTSAPQLFLVPPSIDSASGDLTMELNTSLQGTATLTIIGVDCGSIDAITGDVQRSSNTLLCHITLRHSTTSGAANSNGGTAMRDRPHINGSVHVPYARVPSATQQHQQQRLATNSSTDNANNLAMDAQGNTEGFALSLAHFNQEVSGGDRSRNGSQPRDAANGAAGEQRNPSPAGGGADPPRRRSLDAQGVAARTAAQEAGVVTVSGAYSHTNGRPPPRAGPHSNGGGSSASKTHFSFAVTNPHDLRYRHCTEANRLCRLQQRKEQQARVKKEEEEEEAQRRAQLQRNPAAATGGAGAGAGQSFSSGATTPPPSSDTAVHNTASNWSDEEDRDHSAGATEESLSRSQSGTASGAHRKTGRKSVVEVLELEQEYDQNNPVAMPVMAAANTSSNNTSTQGSNGDSGGRRISPPRRTGDARQQQQQRSSSSGASPSLPDDESDAVANRELRPLRLPASLFFLDGLQSPVSFLRLTVWQDRLIVLFHESDMDLLRSDLRARFKREARQELSESTMGGLFMSTFAWGSSVSSHNGGVPGGFESRKASMQGGRNSSVTAPPHRSYSLSPDHFTGGNHNGSISGTTSPFAGFAFKVAGLGGMANTTAEAEKSFMMVRRLILCLALEEERGSVQLYADTLHLCSHLCHTALLKTTALTRGTREGLQQGAAAVLAAGSPASPKRGSRDATVSNVAAIALEGNQSLSAADRQSLRTLSETLELAMTVMVLLGSYGDAVEYAVQRVHALCLLEGDTTAVVNAAQRDLAEAYLFYGDYTTAATIAEDVVMLAKQLYDETAGAYEVAEAEALAALTSAAAGRRERLVHYVARLEQRMLPVEEISAGATRTPQPLLQAQLRLVLGFSKIYLARTADTVAEGGGTALVNGNNDDPARRHCGSGGSTQSQTAYSNSNSSSSVVTLAREAVRLLRGEGDLQEMEQSFSTVFPIQARLAAGGVDGIRHAAGMASSMTVQRGGAKRASMLTCSVTAGPQSTASMRTLAPALGDEMEAAAKMMAAQKRLRWNMLSFAGALLVRSDVVQEGIEVMENTVKELVLGHHRHVERHHRSSIAALLWVGLVLAKSWAEPGLVADLIPMLKQMANRVVRIKGPLHPFAAVANLHYAHLAHHSTNSRHGLSIAARSLSALERGVGPQSLCRLMAHYVCGSTAESQLRWRPALEHLSAAYAIAQLNHLGEEDLLLMDTRFLGAILLCPSAVVLDLNTTALQARVRDRLQTTQQRVGPHSESLVEPLWNMAEMHHLLKQPNDAIECLKQAVRLLDRRGVLLVSADLLRPVDVFYVDVAQQQQGTPAAGRERVEQLVRQRNTLVQASFDTVNQVLRLATSLFMWAAILESQGQAEEALEKYWQCMALYEAVRLGGESLCAARIMAATAKLLYTVGNCGDALGWARKTEMLMHAHYRKQWPVERDGAEKLVAIVERRLLDEEGTYVVQSDVTAPSGLPQLI